MIPLFLGLTLANIAALILTITLGYVSVGSNLTSNMRMWHTLSGALTLLLCIGVHCVVFTYFIATAKWIQHAVDVKHLKPEYTAPTRSFKAQAFPAALLAMLAVFVAAIGGALVDNRYITVHVHHFLALGALAINLICATVEYRAISSNGQLIDQILADIPPGEIESQAM